MILLERRNLLQASTASSVEKLDTMLEIADSRKAQKVRLLLRMMGMGRVRAALATGVMGMMWLTSRQSKACCFLEMMCCSIARHQ